MASARRKGTEFTVNSPVASMLRRVSLGLPSSRLATEMESAGGSEPTPLK